MKSSESFFCVFANFNCLNVFQLVLEQSAIKKRWTIWITGIKIENQTEF